MPKNGVPFLEIGITYYNVQFQFQQKNRVFFEVLQNKTFSVIFLPLLLGIGTFRIFVIQYDIDISLMIQCINDISNNTP